MGWHCDEIEYRNGVPYRGGLPDDEESQALLDAFRPPPSRPEGGEAGGGDGAAESTTDHSVPRT